MRISEFDWDEATNITREYPNTIGEDLVEWFVNSKRWEDDLDIVHWRINRLREALAEHRVNARRIEKEAKIKADRARQKRQELEEAADTEAMRLLHALSEDL